METIADLCAKYVDDHPNLRRTKLNVLERLQDEPIGKIKAPGRAKDFIAHCRLRRADCAPATVLKDVMYLRVVLAYAKPGWDMPHVTDVTLKESFPILRQEGLIGSSKHRTRQPTTEEGEKIIAYFRDGKIKSGIPMVDILEFQWDSTRRISETTGLLWADLDEKKKVILVRNMKHPTHKDGNHKLVALPEKSLEIILRQPRDPGAGAKIFPYRTSSVKQLYYTARDAVGLNDLRLHDFRRGAIGKLFDAGRDVRDVMLVTGHERPDLPLTTYNGAKAEDFHRPRT